MSTSDIRASACESELRIAQDHRARVEAVEPFVQVDRHLSAAREGVGLGLAISRDLAHGRGGDLAVESEVGQGRTCTPSLAAA